MIVFNPKILQNTLTLISSQIKRKTLYWVSVEIILIAAHVVGVVFMFEDIQVNTNTNTNRSNRQIFSVTWSWWRWSLPPTWRSASSTCSTSTSAWSSARDTGDKDAESVSNVWPFNDESPVTTQETPKIITLLSLNCILVPQSRPLGFFGCTPALS